MTWYVEPGVVAYAVLAILVTALAAYAAFWAWRVHERIGPPRPDRPGHETERFQFKYGGEPPGADGGGQPSTG
jgi:hypothetical protein